MSAEKPEPLICSECGNTDLECFRYTEKIENHRAIVKVEDGVFHVTSAYETGEGYDDGEDPHFECTECFHRWPVPEEVAKNIEWAL